MSHTVVGMFDSAAQAQQAAQQLAAAGFSNEHVDVSSTQSGGSSVGSGASNAVRPDRDPSDYNNTSGTATEGAADAAGRTGDSIGGFFSNLFGNDTEDTRRYSHAARNSGSIVTVHCHSADNAHRAAEILDRAGAVDVDERAAQTGYAGANNIGANTNANAGTTNANAGSNANAGTTNVNTGTNNYNATGQNDQGMAAQVIEENLQVGKRVEQTGGARLRSRIVERPVEASVRLREEHVNIQRNPVNRPATDADFAAFKEGEIEITESAERAVVSKEARVVEEVTLSKEVTEREEIIRDTVRKTEVDVEPLNGAQPTPAATT